MVAFLLAQRRGRLKVGNLTLDFANQRASVERSGLPELDKSLDPAERQYLLLKAYHEQSLGQSRISMWFSLTFAAIGFGVIIAAVFLGGADKTPTSPERLIKLVSGTIIDAVAGLFFVQSNKARELMADFFEKLRTDRKLDESLRLANSVPDVLLKSRLQSVLSMNFAQVAIKDEILLAIFGLPSLEQHTSVGVEASPTHGVPPPT